MRDTILNKYLCENEIEIKIGVKGNHISGVFFDESKSNNPFAYYTAAVTNSFVRVINLEKRNQNIRDDILEQNGLDPSYTRQHAGEWEASVKREQGIK